MESFGFKDHTPFKEPLDDSSLEKDGGISTFLEIKSRPNKLIRKVDIHDAVDSYNFSAFHRGSVSLFEAARILVGHIKELNKYGINVPAEFVVGEDQNNKPALFMIVDKVIGKNLRELEGSSMTNSLKEELDNLWTNLIGYLIDKMGEEDGLIMCDIFRSNQYMYGKIKGSEEEKIYLVDMDPIVSFVDDSMIESIERNIEDLEMRYNISLTNAKSKLIEIKQASLI